MLPLAALQYGYWLPPDHSVHGSAVDSLIHVIHWFMLALFVGWGSFMVYCLWRFRSKANPKATYEPVKAKLSKVLEIGVVIFEAVLLVGFSMPAWAAYKDQPPPSDKAMHVRVVGQQFQWNIWYPGPDGKFGRAKLDLIDGVNPVGLDRSDPAGKDDVVKINQLAIPVGKPIIAHITAKDVIHSFSVPVLRVKQDANPGMTVPIWFEATQTGTYDIACAQLCGNQHWRMRGMVMAMEPAAFDEWLAKQKR